MAAACAKDIISLDSPVAKSTFHIPDSFGAFSPEYLSFSPLYPYPGRVSFTRAKSNVSAHVPSGLKAYMLLGNMRVLPVFISHILDTNLPSIRSFQITKESLLGINCNWHPCCHPQEDDFPSLIHLHPSFKSIMPISISSLSVGERPSKSVRIAKT